MSLTLTSGVFGLTSCTNTPSSFFNKHLYKSQNSLVLDAGCRPDVDGNPRSKSDSELQRCPVSVSEPNTISGQLVNPTPSVGTLKRSFEVEDVDTSSHSPGSRRTTSTPHRNAMSPTSIYYRDLGTAAQATNNNNLNYTQPRSIMGGGGSKTPEPVSRRSELSIDISSSSKHVDNVTSPSSTRFATHGALKRPEVLGHSKTPEMGHKREVTFAKAPADSPGTRRNEGNNNNNGTSRTPEQNHTRKFEPPSPGDVRKPDISITRAPPENNGHHPAVHHPHHPNPHHNTIVTSLRCSSPNHAGRKSPNHDSKSD
ncbi:hypothetical protein D5F01_LYC00128 [Larimichthys crocea]|uniref:Uncharacterized protein n=1 Tax=Larimichthys crocea TaxID=215358 RepID=A0A6G0J8S1_LARCR|nr:hypothetical protein D5F01_LYC00128 [Larimichthys crocea]